ncbi:hypothetical protein J7M28_00340, partial [bacterium]|nr:hypothetical protein [bacterium]
MLNHHANSGGVALPLLPAVAILISMALVGAGLYATVSVSNSNTWRIANGDGPSSWCTCATISNLSPIELDFEALGDEIALVELWYRLSLDDGASFAYEWSFSGVSTDATVGMLEFEPVIGKGLYEFYTVAENGAGQREDAPGSADCYTRFIPMFPGSFCWSPDSANQKPIPVDFAAYAPDNSSVATVALFYRRLGELQTPFIEYSEYGVGTRGTIEFTLGASMDDGVYEFYTVARDSEDREEDPPAKADASTAYDTIAPESEGSCDERSSSSEIVVSFVASDEISGVESTRLFFRLNGADWS